MNYKALSVMLFLTLALSIIAPAYAAPATSMPVKQSVGPASDYLNYTQVDLSQVPAAIGVDIDVYLYGLRPSIAEVVKSNPNVKLLAVPSGLVDFIFNPAPVYYENRTGEYTKEEIATEFGTTVDAIVYYEQGPGYTYFEIGAAPGYGINPFAFRKVRFAMNYLIDRDYIVNNIYRGYAAPMYTFLSPYDPDYAVIADIVAEYKFAYAPSIADRIITNVLTKVGAEKVSGKWYYNGEPITLQFVIRVEDERKEIGDSLAIELERLGFTVQRNYLTFGEAIYRVYFTDPAQLQWHIYTEGWGKGAIDKYDSTTINQFGAPWYGWLPGLLVPGWWSYHNKTIDELGQRIYFGKFNSKEERNQLYRECTEMIIQEAVRVWVANRLELQPYTTDVSGVTEDLGSGLRSPFNLREMYTPTGTLRIGHLHVWTPSSIWNPWGGFEDVYSVDIMRATVDPAIWRHPFNGRPIPFRENFKVVTAGPNGTLPVPSDAFVWDAENDQFVSVGPGVTAKSVVYLDLSKYLGAKFHDGVTISWADVLVGIALNYEIAYDPVKSQREGNIAGPIAAYLSVIKGYKIFESNDTLAVYLDYWHFDENYIADYAATGVGEPAELHVLMFYLAFSSASTLGKLYALSSDRSEAEGIPVLDLVVPEVAQDVKAAAQYFLDNGLFNASLFTVGGTTYMTTSEWQQRLQALINWINAHGHAWVAQGPFYIDSFDKDAQRANLVAFRDPTYPFGPGTWYFGMARKTEIISVYAPPISPGTPVDIFVDVTGIPPIYVKYIIRDPAVGKVILSGDAEPTTGTTYKISLSADFTDTLREYSTYELTVIAFSDQVAMPDSKTVVITTIGRGINMTQINEQIANVSSSLNTRLAELQEQLRAQLGSAVANAIQNLSAQLSQSIAQLGSTTSEAIQNVTLRIASLSERLDTIDSKVGDAASKADNAAKKVDELSNKVSSIEGAVGTVQILVIIAILLGLINLAIPFIKK